MSYTTDRFAIRTVRNGRVKIGGKWFAPVSRPDFLYDGRLEGMRLAFGRYLYYKTMEGLEMVNLWGTARDFMTRDSEQWVDYPGPNCIDGTIYWSFWDEVLHD